ncbi:MAG: tetratricopeptide repeat protein, partial [Burkholderiales bacterium]
LRAAPNEAMGYNDLAYVYAEQAHNYKLAKKYADKAFRLAPHDANVLDTLGWVYYKLGKYQQAYTYIKDSYQANPSAEGAAHLKAVYLALNKPELAKQVAVEAKSYLHPQVELHLLHKSLALLMDLQYGTKVK